MSEVVCVAVVCTIVVSLSVENYLYKPRIKWVLFKSKWVLFGFGGVLFGFGWVLFGFGWVLFRSRWVLFRIVFWGANQFFRGFLVDEVVCVVRPDLVSDSAWSRKPPVCRKVPTINPSKHPKNTLNWVLFGPNGFFSPINPSKSSNQPQAPFRIPTALVVSKPHRLSPPFCLTVGTLFLF